MSPVKTTSPYGVFDNDAHRVGNGVRDAEEADRGVTEVDDFVFLDFADLDWRQSAEFLLALFDHHAGKSARVDRRIADAVDDIGDAADVVEVAVRDKHPADLVAALFEITGVGQDVVDARRVVFAELESAVDDKDVVAEFDRGHVAADLLDAAERNDTYGIGTWQRDGAAVLRRCLAVRRGVMLDALLTAARRTTAAVARTSAWASVLATRLLTCRTLRRALLSVSV